MAPTSPVPPTSTGSPDYRVNPNVPFVRGGSATVETPPLEDLAARFRGKPGVHGRPVAARRGVLSGRVAKSSSSAAAASASAPAALMSPGGPGSAPASSSSSNRRNKQGLRVDTALAAASSRPLRNKVAAVAGVAPDAPAPGPVAPVAKAKRVKGPSGSSCMGCRKAKAKCEKVVSCEKCAKAGVECSGFPEEEEEKQEQKKAKAKAKGKGKGKVVVRACERCKRMKAACVRQDSCVRCLKKGIACEMA